MSIPTPSIPIRITPQRLALAAFVCLLLVAAGLRFYGLPGHYLWSDEAVAANIADGALTEVILDTRRYNSSPILYPLALWVVQKVDVSIFSVRVLPATASVLTVAVMLFLLPRLGVSRWAAFLAALLTTLSVEAIRTAQDVREYSIDALLAVLLIAGLLWYLRDGRKSLLCVALFLAPLLQYGLVLFGVAVMGAAIVLPSPSTLGTPERDSQRSWIRNWLRQRVALVWPAACFMAGSAISYVVTVRYQWQEGGFGSAGYLQSLYYQGEIAASAIFEFAVDGIWSLLTYHLPEEVAIAAIPAFAILLIAVVASKFQGHFQSSPIAVLFSLCIVISVGAAVLGIYPIGSIRAVIYLGPIIFLAAGVAAHTTAGSLAALTRQQWLTPTLTIAAAAAILLAARADALHRESYWPLYSPRDNGGAIVALLQERASAEDVIYFGHRMRQVMNFHQRSQIGEVVLDVKAICRRPRPETCFPEMIAAVTPPADLSKLWLISEHPWHTSGSELRVLLALAEHVTIEHIVSGGSPNLYLIQDTAALIKIAAATDMLRNIKPVLPDQPPIRSTFDIYHSADLLIYHKEPCRAEDVQEPFFLHIYPAETGDLPPHRRQHGFDHLDFVFPDYSLPLHEGCFALRALPDYPILRINTGQYNAAGPLWAVNINLDE